MRTAVLPVACVCIALRCAVAAQFLLEQTIKLKDNVRILKAEKDEHEALISDLVTYTSR